MKPDLTGEKEVACDGLGYRMQAEGIASTKAWRPRHPSAVPIPGNTGWPTGLHSSRSWSFLASPF